MSDICAVVHTVLVKCVWMLAQSRSCRLWNATKSKDVLMSLLESLFVVVNIIFLFVYGTNVVMAI